MKPPIDAARRSAVRHYQFVCLLALLVLFLVLVERGVDTLGLFPLLLGGVAIALSWSIGPPLILLTLGFLLTNWGDLIRTVAQSLALRIRGFRTGLPQEEPSLLNELALVGATLAYVIGMFRLQSLSGTIFPVDRRRPAPDVPRQSGLKPRRPSRDVSREVAGLALSLLIWVGLGFLARMLVESPDVGEYGFTPEVWRIVLFVWIVGSGAIVLASVAGYLRLRGASEEEARMYLQDQLWRETRREQSRLNHWLHWARLRRQNREERR